MTPRGTKKYNAKTIKANTITVVSSGVAIQGPDVRIPSEFSVLLMNSPLNTGSPIVRVAPSEAQAALASGANWPLEKGDQVALAIENLNQLWFNANASGVDINYIVESRG